MFGRGKLVTSSVRAAALVAGAVIFAPFFAFADPLLAPAAITFTVTPGATPLLFEGGAAGVFVLTVENISPVPIQAVSINRVITALGGLDSSDTLAEAPSVTADACRPATGPIVLANGDKCTITFAVKPVGNGPPETEVPVDFGLTQVEFTVGTIPAPPLIPTVTSRSALADFRVEDVPVPEPATLFLLATGALCLTTFARLRRGNVETT
jgi:PEP-CTERM motif